MTYDTRTNERDSNIPNTIRRNLFTIRSCGTMKASDAIRHLASIRDDERFASNRKGTVKDTNGNEYYVAGVITSDYPNVNQIYPGHWQVNIGQSLDPSGKPVPESGITLPEHLAKRWLNNEIRIKL